MTPQRWEHLKTPFNEPLEKPWQGRRTFVTENFGDELKLRRELFSPVWIHEARHEGRLPITEMI